jgi:hypothetical protein
MRKRYTKQGCAGKRSRKKRQKGQAGKGRTVQLVLDPEELVAMMQDSLTNFATEMGLKVACLLLEDEVDQRCGSRYERVPQRTVTRYGHQRGVAVIAGQKLPIRRPRMRYTQQCGDLPAGRVEPVEWLGIEENVGGRHREETSQWLEKAARRPANRRPSSSICGRRWKRTGSWRRLARRKREVTARSVTAAFMWEITSELEVLCKQ